MTIFQHSRGTVRHQKLEENDLQIRDGAHGLFPPYTQVELRPETEKVHSSSANKEHLHNDLTPTNVGVVKAFCLESSISKCWPQRQSISKQNRPITSLPKILRNHPLPRVE